MLLQLFFSLFLISGADTHEAQQLVKIVDYIGADYSGAVADGKIISDFEYEEISQFQKSAQEKLELLLEKESDAEAQQLKENMSKLGESVEQKRAPVEVAALAKQIREKLIVRFNISIAPSSAPSFSSGKKLFAANCAACHGETGNADTAIAKTFNPVPRNFHDPEVIAALTPFRAYNTISLGIEGTPMPAFSALSEKERWDLAFYVFTLQNAEAGIDPLLIASTQLEASQSAFSKGNFRAAENARLSAYLDGVEKIEPRLRALDPEATVRLEKSFLDLAIALKSKEAVSIAPEKFAAVAKELHGAREILRTREDRSEGAFGLSLLIILREGIEAALIVGAILGLLKNANDSRARRTVHLSWIGAILAGFLTWLGAQELIEISGAQREFVEGIASLLAAGVLFYVSYWLLSKVDQQRWTKFIHSHVQGYLVGGSLFALAGLSFVAVYRESFETVLFYQALLQSYPESSASIGLGFFTGVAALVVLIFLMFKLGKRLPLRKFFLVTGALLYALSFVLAGEGIWALQEGGFVNITPISIPQIPWLGIYPTAEGAFAQGLFLLALIVGAAWVFLRANSSTNSQVVKN